MKFYSILLVIILSIYNSYASYIPKIHGVKWQSTETEHFIIHYHDGLSYTARKIKAIADDVYVKVTSFYDFPLKKKVHIILLDNREGTNGFAISSIDMVNIEATNLYFNNFNLRGRSDWIKNVLTHEFAHIVSLKRATIFGERVSTFNFFPVINESPDEIAGRDPNTNFYASMIVPSKVNPYWWIEGTAQFATDMANYDTFDTHREMFLRTATLEDNLLTQSQMSVKGAMKSPYGELAYCQGFSLNHYLASIYGNKFSNKLIDNTKETYPSWLSAMEKTFNKNADKIFNEWKNEIEKKYLTIAMDETSSLKEGKMVALSKDEEIVKRDFYKIDPTTNEPFIRRINKEEKNKRKKSGKYNIYPKISMDGKWISFIRDNNLYVKLRENLEYELIINDVSAYDWSFDSKFIVYSTSRADGRGYHSGFLFNDLAVIDLSELNKLSLTKNRVKIKKQQKLLAGKFKLFRKNFITDGMRADEPAWSPDGKHIAFIQNGDGTKKLKILDITEGEIKDTEDFGEGTQANSPSWSGDSKRIVFSLYKDNKQELWIYDTAEMKSYALTSSASDVRDPFWHSSNLIYFSSDMNKIFNIYSINPETKKVEKITNLITGGFMPFVSPDSKELLYSNFSSYGFKIFSLALAEKSLDEYSNEEESFDFNKIVERQKDQEYPELGKEQKYLIAHFFPRLKNLIPIQLVPEFYLYGGQAGMGLSAIAEDYLSNHRLQGRFLLDEDQIYSVAYKNNLFYPVFTLSYSRIINKNFAHTLYSQSFLETTGLEANENPGLYSALTIEFYDARAEYFVDKEKLEGARFGIGYNYRGISADVPASSMGADLTDTYFANAGTYDRNGSYGDAESFPILSTDSYNAKVGYLKGIEVGSESVSLSGDNDINPKGYGIVLNYSFSNSYQDGNISSFGIYGRRNEGEPTSDYSFNVYRVDGTYAVQNPYRKKDTFEARFNTSFVDKIVTINDKLFLGGQPLFQTYRDVSNSYTFPGYGGYSIYGESRIVLSMAYRFPIYTDLWKDFNLFFFDDLYVNLFANAGNVWTYGEIYNSKQDRYVDGALVSHGPPLLFDIGFTMRSRAFVFYQYPWYSFLTVAHGFQDSAKYGFSDSDWPVRIYMGLGLSL